MLGALRTTVRDCGGLSLAATGIVPSILLFVTFLKVWHGIERILTAQSCFWSGLVAPFYAFSVNLQMRWAGPEEVVPTVVLRNAIATTSAAGNAATYFVHEIGSLQRHSLATVDGVTLFTPMAVPTAEVAEVEQAIEKLQKGLEDFVPRELAWLYNIRATIAHMIRDLSPQHDAGSSPGGKEKKHHKTLRKHLKDLEKLLIETVNHRKEVREDAMEIEMSAGDAGRTLGELQLAVEETNEIAQGYLIDAGGSKIGGSVTTTAKEPSQELLERIEDLAVQIWLQHAEMKARRARADGVFTACSLELSKLSFLEVHVALLSGKVSRSEVGVEDAAKDLLEVVHRLIQSTEEDYLQIGHHM